MKASHAKNKALIAKVLSVVFEAKVHPKHAAYLLREAADKLQTPDAAARFEMGVPPGVQDEQVLGWLLGDPVEHATTGDPGQSAGGSRLSRDRP